MAASLRRVENHGAYAAVCKQQAPATIVEAPLQGERCAALAVICYAAFVPLVLRFAPSALGLGIMAAVGLSCMFFEVYAVVERQAMMPNRRTPSRSYTDCAELARDILQFLRIASGVFVPALLATVGGGSFLLDLQLQRMAQDCSVPDLPRLALDGATLSFACDDGFVALHMQARAGSNGYVAPIFASHAAWERRDAPVAWAVKADSKVGASICYQNPAGTCGIFATPLRDRWRSFPSLTPRFGKEWGWSLTSLKEEELRRAAKELERRLNTTSPANNAPFVIAEGMRQYFGNAYIFLWVAIALLAVGAVDRLAQFAEWRTLSGLAREEADDHERQAEIALAQALPSARRAGLLHEVIHFWSDPLGTAHRAPAGAGASAFADVEPSRRQMWVETTRR